MKVGTEYLTIKDVSGKRIVNTPMPDWAEWPPPSEVFLIRSGEVCLGLAPTQALADGFVESFGGEVSRFELAQHSEIDDEAAAEMDHVVRGALYVPLVTKWDGRT